MQRMTAVVLLLLAVMVHPAAGGDDVYIVKPGDTLSGIAQKLYGDAAKWPELLKANPQVTDPALIYPGDSLAAEAGEVYTVSSGGKAEPFTGHAPLPVAPPQERAAAVPVPANLPLEIVKPPLRVSASRYRSAGYISKELPGGTIIGSVASRHSLVEGDEIIVDQPADEGTAFTILRPMQQVYHPATGEYLGWILKVVGWADVTCRGEHSSRARLADTVDVVTIGDFVVPFDPGEALENDIIDSRKSPFCLKKEFSGYIVATQEQKRTLVEGDIVFVDRGREDGVVTGDQFSVYEDWDREWPVEFGVLQVIRVGEKTSTALVVRSDREIAVSDTVQPRFSGPGASGS
jgi:hypothetical protein